MPRRARRTFAAFGLVQGGLNALTVQPFAVSRVVPFALHGLLEKSSAPIYFGLPPLLGLAQQRKARTSWLLLGAVIVTVSPSAHPTTSLRDAVGPRRAVGPDLTDWDAKRTAR